MVLCANSGVFGQNTVIFGARFGDDKTIVICRYCLKSSSSLTSKEPVMKAEKEETTCLLDIAGKGSVKTSIQFPVKGKTDMCPVHKPVIKGDKG